MKFTIDTTKHEVYFHEPVRLYEIQNVFRDYNIPDWCKIVGETVTVHTYPYGFPNYQTFCGTGTITVTEKQVDATNTHGST
jgi:hypothetical protein